MSETTFSVLSPKNSVSNGFVLWPFWLTKFSVWESKIAANPPSFTTNTPSPPFLRLFLSVWAFGVVRRIRFFSTLWFGCVLSCRSRHWSQNQILNQIYNDFNDCVQKHGMLMNHSDGYCCTEIPFTNYCFQIYPHSSHRSGFRCCFNFSGQQICFIRSFVCLFV